MWLSRSTVLASVLLAGILILANARNTAAGVNCNPTGSGVVDGKDSKGIIIHMQEVCDNTNSDFNVLTCNVDTGSCEGGNYTFSFTVGEFASFDLTNSNSNTTTRATCISGNCLSSGASSFTGGYFYEHNGFKYFQGSQYVFTNEKASFEGGIAICTSMDAFMPSVTSRAENSFIYDLDPVEQHARWLGGRVSHHPSYLEWVDGTPVTDFLPDPSYQGCDPDVDCLYQRGEPNNANGDEFCLAQGSDTKVIQNPSGWADETCSNDLFIVCEKAIVCGSVELSLQKGGVNMNCKENAKVGSTCYVKCDEGYGPSYPTFVTCEETGLYSGVPKCFPIDCGADIANLDQDAVVAPGCDSTLYGSECTATCPIGNEVTGDGLFSCNNHGDWIGSLACDLYDCGPSPETFDSNVISNLCVGDTHYGGDSCELTCREGFSQEGGVYECSVNGTWSGDVSCTEIFCPNATTIPDAMLGEKCGGLNHGLECNFECAYGTVPHPSRTTNATCNIGVWETDLECVEDVPCANQELTSAIPADAVLDCPGNFTSIGSYCYATCQDGFDLYEDTNGYFELTDKASYLCGAGWEGPTVQCAPIQCGVLIFGLDENASADCLHVSGFYNTECVATCNDGFTATEGDGIYKCNKVGLWEGSLTCM
eukprot:m.7443 g.7443  ORF g.7443 m.7443 type:complete len:650 (-) comp2805_c0_seq1:93-2042(-)